MIVKEYGKDNQEIVILLHGGGLSWWNYQEVAEKLKDKYRVIIPILDGHAGSDRNFTTIEDNAREIYLHIQENYGGKVFAIGGLSLGGQILIELLNIAPNICKKAIIESALVKPMKFTNKMISYSVNMSYGLISKRWFAKLQFKQLHMKSDLFEVYYEDTCKISKKSIIAFLKSNSSYKIKNTVREATANVTVVVGGKEQRIMKESAQIIHDYIPKSKLLVNEGYHHGELSISHAKEYVRLIDSVLSS